MSLPVDFKLPPLPEDLDFDADVAGDPGHWRLHSKHQMRTYALAAASAAWTASALACKEACAEYHSEQAAAQARKYSDYKEGRLDGAERCAAACARIAEEPTATPAGRAQKEST